jgi:hypothetical protein
VSSLHQSTKEDRDNLGESPPANTKKDKVASFQICVGLAVVGEVKAHLANDA